MRKCLRDFFSVTDEGTQYSIIQMSSALEIQCLDWSLQTLQSLCKCAYHAFHKTHEYKTPAYTQALQAGLSRWNYSVRSTSCHCNIFLICLESRHIWQMFRAYSIVTYFINENDAGLNLDGQWEHSSSQLLWFAVPLVSQSGGLEINKAASRCFRCCFGN